MTSLVAEAPAPRPAESPGVAGSRLPVVRERPWAVGVHLAFAAFVGLAWSAPLAAAVSRVTGAYPRGDAELFDPGAVMLAEAARLVSGSSSAIGAAWAVVAIAALPLGLVVLAFVLVELAARRPPGPRLALARALRFVPSLALIGLVALAAHAVVIAILMIGGGEIVRSTWPIPPPRDVARLGLFGVILLAVLAVGVAHDLARAAAVSGPARVYSALRIGLRAFARAPLLVAWAYAWRALLGLGCVVAAAWLGVLVGQRSPLALAVSALVHQAGLAAAGWMRLSWLSRAMRLVEPMPGSGAEDTDERDPEPPGSKRERGSPASAGRPPIVPAPGSPQAAQERLAQPRSVELVFAPLASERGPAS